MKKIIGIIVLAMMVVLPMGVNAASITGVTSSISKVSTDDTAGTETYEITMNVTEEKFNQLGGTLQLINVTLESISTNDTSWTNVSSGTAVLFKPTSGDVISKGAHTFTVVVKKINLAEECKVSWVHCASSDGQTVCDDTPAPTTPTCKIVNGKYYGKNGSEVTKEVYEAECVSNPKTGNFLPYIVIATGLVLAVGVFTVSRKNNKLYKI